MDGLKKILGSGPMYVGLYLLFMIPTYVLPYLGSNSIVANAALSATDAVSNEVSGLNMLMFVHLACLGALCLLAWLRGAVVDKAWIVVLPIIAAIFDMMPGLNWVPLVPTVMHITAIIVGVSSKPVAV